MIISVCDICLAEGKLTIAKGSREARIQNLGADNRPSGLKGLMMGPEPAPSNLYAGRVVVHFCVEHEEKIKDEDFAVTAKLLNAAAKGLHKMVDKIAETMKDDGEEEKGKNTWENLLK